MPYNLDKAYSPKFYTQRKSLSWRIPIVVNAIMDVINPKSVIDAGCGNGAYLSQFSTKTNNPCYGIEGTKNALASPYLKENKNIIIHDLRLPLNNTIPHHVDLVICLDVAEHIDDECADVFVDNLCSLSDRILISASPPGQGGRYHINCQPQLYWFYKFTVRGYRLNHTIVDNLRSRWCKWKDKKGIKAYYHNLMCWEMIK